MVKLRLKRLGRKKHPFYRIVAMNANAPRSGQALAELGTYDPMAAVFDLDEEADLDAIADAAFDAEPQRRRVLPGRAAYAIATRPGTSTMFGSSSSRPLSPRPRRNSSTSRLSSPAAPQRRRRSAAGAPELPRSYRWFPMPV